MTNKPVTEAGQIALAGVKVYVAGPMTGLPEFNRPAFFAAEAHLKELGAVVMNPAILPDGFSHDAYMRIAIPMLMECEVVAFLPGWQHSSGAWREFVVANTNKISLYQLGVGEVAGQLWITNIDVLADHPYYNMEAWKACEDRSLTLEQFEGQELILSFDLARKLDMNSMARLFWRDIDGKRHYYSIAPEFWVPEDTAFNTDNRRLAERYQKWMNLGELSTTEGAEIDYREILAVAKEAAASGNVLEVPLDPAGATALAHDLADEGLTPISITQNYTNMSDPMRELEAAIQSGRFHHDGNSLMTWCIGNVIGKNLPGNDDVVRPVKESADQGIGGAVALMMAIGRAMVAGRSDT